MYRFSASCKPPQTSQWNLLRSHNISLALNCRRHAETLEFCSISILKSKNTSSLVVKFSQVRHFVSEVNIPSKSSCTQRALFGALLLTLEFSDGCRLFSNLSTDSTMSFNK